MPFFLPADIIKGKFFFQTVTNQKEKKKLVETECFFFLPMDKEI